MKLWDAMGFELPSIFGRLSGITAPHEKIVGENRSVADALARPQIQFFDPGSLHFPDHTLPTVPGNSNITCGVGMVEYNHEPRWDRANDAAGPVRKFFRDLMYDNRIKHL
jgi:hypothetical protein